MPGRGSPERAGAGRASRTPPPGPLSLVVQYAARGARVPERARVRRWVRAALAGAARVCVRFVDEPEGRALNARWRRRDYATNVLSFPYDRRAGALEGDLVLCVPVVLREARAQGKAPLDHFAHLVVHGCLHLAGHDHDTTASAAEMEALERAILARFRIPDPYA